MKQHTRVLLALPAAALVMLCVLVILSPFGVGAATHSVTTQPRTPHLPHFFWQHKSKIAAPHSNFYSPAHSDLQAAGNNLTYRGGPVMAGTAHVYAIFWEPTGNVSANYNNLIKRLFSDIGNTTLYKLNAQYTQSNGGFPTNAVLMSSWVDSGAYPSSILLDKDIQAEVTHAQQVNGWSSNLNNVFFVFLQRGTNLCFTNTQSPCASNAFCAYHNFFGTNTLYAAMPYAASFSCNPASSPNGDDADQTINVTSHELMESATDPLLNAWVDSNGQENGDKCNFTFGPLNAQGADVVWHGHPYIVQEEWDNRGSSCRLMPDTAPIPTPTSIPTATPTNTPIPSPTPANTPTPTNTPAPSPTPQPGGDEVVNAGFENGVSPWLESSAGGFEIINPTSPHGGTHSAYLCGYDSCNDQIWQNITLPDSFNHVTFSYWTDIGTSETTKTACDDTFSAGLRTGSGTTLVTVQKQCNLNTHGWTKYTFTVTSQLNAYKGQVIQVYFQGITNASLPTDFFLDDVSLVVS